MQVHPRDPELRRALTLAGIFATCLFVFHLAANIYQSHTGWGYFRDEFYYIACGRHLAWGYVDHGPLVALQARLAETLFGHSLAGLRALSALAGAGRLFLTGILAWALGGRRPAQALAMFGVAFAPQYLALDGFLSMNSCESLFWMSALLALILIIRSGNQRWWLLFGAASGLGLLNKPSMAFFLVALLAAILLTRRDLFSRWTLIAVALMLVIIAPYVHWQIVNHWPTWEFLQNGRREHKNKTFPPLQFLVTQVMNLEPASALIWVPGLVLLFRRKPYRFLALTYVFFLLGMMALHAKDYYVVPIYPILFAAGGLAWETRFAQRRLVLEQRAFAFPAAILTLAAISIAVLPMDTPILSPAAWVKYAAATHQYNVATNSENDTSGALPQFYADRFGWQEEVDIIQRTYDALSPADQARVVILTSNYGEAGAIDFLGHNLPPARCGQNNYFLWGPGTKPGDLLILVETTTQQHLESFGGQVTKLGTIGTTYAMPYESRRSIWLMRDTKQTIQTAFPEHRDYI